MSRKKPPLLPSLLTTSMTLSALVESKHEEAAQLIHRSLVSWYETHLRQGKRFGDDPKPFGLFPEMYAALDPGQAIAACDSSGALLGVCFAHPRETHWAVGIVAIAPEAAGRGIARAMLEEVLKRAQAEDKPVRLISSLLNLDSFSLYTRLGFTPHTMYQDMSINVPVGGLEHTPPPRAAGVRLALPGEASRIADFEAALQGIRREGDFRFFLNHTVGSWKVWVLEDDAGELSGVLVSSHHPDWGMLGPGVTRDPESAIALLWRALDARRGEASVVLVACVESDVVRKLYQWGARNIELHVAQSTNPVVAPKGIAFPTFLPESA